jgi:hypothetical protein
MRDLSHLGCVQYKLQLLMHVCSFIRLFDVNEIFMYFLVLDLVN